MIHEAILNSEQVDNLVSTLTQAAGEARIYKRGMSELCPPVSVAPPWVCVVRRGGAARSNGQS